MITKCVLAGGCYWGVEELFRLQPGVVDTTVGFVGGTAKFFCTSTQRTEQKEILKL